MSTQGRPETLRPYTWVLIALWVAEATGAFETAMILAAVKQLVADYGGAAKVGWLITVYLIVSAAGSALVGRMGDLFGRRRVLLMILLVAGVGSVLSAWAPSYPYLLAGRALQGISGAVLPLCVGLARENLPSKFVAPGIGLIMSGASVGTAAGLVLGGWIVDVFRWQALFAASALFCVVAAAVVAIWVPRSKAQSNAKRVDWLAGVAFAPGTLALLYYVTSAGKTGWTAPLNLAALIGGLLVLAWWVRRSLRHPEPLINLRLLMLPQVAISAVVTSFIALGALQITLVFQLLLQAPRWTLIGLGLSATLAGLAKLPSNALAVFAGPVSGWLTGRAGGRLTMLAGGALTTLGWLLALRLHDNLAQIVMVLCVISFGTTVLVTVGPTIIAQATPRESTSEVVGVLYVIRGLAMGVGAQMVTTLLSRDVVSLPGGGESFPGRESFLLTIAVIVGLSLAATLIALALPRGRPAVRVAVAGGVVDHGNPSLN